MRPRLLHRADPALVLFGILLVINLLAVFGLSSSRRDAQRAIREQRRLEIRADVRAFEALLAQEHADLSFLAQTPALAAIGASPEAADDPVVRRWARLDVEGSLLLYLQASPAVRRLEVSLQPDAQRIVASRLGGVPQLVAPEHFEPDGLFLVSAQWPLGGNGSGRGGRLKAWLDPALLLTTLDPELRLYRQPPTTRTASDSSWEVVAPGVWSPDLEAWVERRESDAGVARTVERLADRFGWTLMLNVLLIPLSLVLLVLTARRIRRLARFEAEAEQQSQMRALESQVQHAERLASLGRFAAGIGHEINNPLEGIANYLRLLEDDLAGGSVDEARQWLPRLREGLDRTAGTVRQVMSYAEPGRSERQPVDLSEIVTSTILFLEGHQDCRDVDIRSECPPSLRLVGDPQTLGQLVLNLVLNACQAQIDMPSPREFEPEVVVQARSSGAMILFEVLDRGPGFAPRVREHLFEPFQSTRGSLGLGLAVCQAIVAGHGGGIEVADRTDGRGTRVRVSLPTDLPSSLADDTTTGTSDLGGRRMIRPENDHE